MTAKALISLKLFVLVDNPFVSSITACVAILLVVTRIASLSEGKGSQHGERGLKTELPDSGLSNNGPSYLYPSDVPGLDQYFGSSQA
jgi:hypothetical protein